MRYRIQGFFNFLQNAYKFRPHRNGTEKDIQLSRKRMKLIKRRYLIAQIYNKLIINETIT